MAGKEKAGLEGQVIAEIAVIARDRRDRKGNWLQMQAD